MTDEEDIDWDRLEKERDEMFDRSIEKEKKLFEEFSRWPFKVNRELLNYIDTFYVFRRSKDGGEFVREIRRFQDSDFTQIFNESINEHKWSLYFGDPESVLYHFIRGASLIRKKLQ